MGDKNKDNDIKEIEIDIKEEKSKRFCDEFRGFCSATTAHGFINFTGTNKARRLFWGTVCLGTSNAISTRTRSEISLKPIPIPIHGLDGESCYGQNSITSVMIYYIYLYR